MVYEIHKKFQLDFNFRKEKETTKYLWFLEIVGYCFVQVLDTYNDFKFYLLTHLLTHFLFLNTKSSPNKITRFVVNKNPNKMVNNINNRINDSWLIIEKLKVL